MKLNYSSLAKKINLLNNKGIYDLQYESCLFTQRYYTEEINCHLLITLYKSHACTVNIILNLISSEGGGRPLTYVLRYNFTQPNFKKL